MIKKQIKQYASIEKILTYAGLTLVFAGFAATVYGALANTRFIHDALDILYYYRYVIMLGGGLLVGVFASWRSAEGTQPRLFIGTVYALVTLGISQVLDVARVLLTDMTNSLGYPWGKAAFNALPLVALIITAIVALIAQRKQKQLSNLAPAIIVASFIAYELYLKASTIYYVNTQQAQVNYQVDPVWLTIVSVLANPLFIAVVAYVLLNKVASKKVRLFYASYIAMVAMYLMFILWEFNTDPTVGATNIFGAIAASAVALFSGVIIWRVRAAAK